MTFDRGLRKDFLVRKVHEIEGVLKEPYDGIRPKYR
jgi:hypothetical protein